MMRLLLPSLFFVMLAADTLGLNLSLAPGVSVKNAFLYLGVLAIAIEAAMLRNRQLELMKVVIPYALAAVYAIFSWAIIQLTKIYPDYSALGSLITLKGGLADHVLVFLVFFYGLLNARDVMWLLKILIWMTVIGNIITVVDALDIPDLGLINIRTDGRVGGPIGESNQYAAFLTLFLPCALGLALIEKGSRRALAFLGFSASVLAFLMTASRGGLVGIVGGAFFGSVFLRNYVSVRAIVMTVGGLLVISILALSLMFLTGYEDLLNDRFMRSISGDAAQASSGRTFIWAKVLGVMFSQPWSLFVGFGWDAYWEYPQFQLAPHSTYLKIFFELGIIGLSLVLVAFANMLRIARRALHRADSEASTILFVFVIGLIGILLSIIFIDLYSPWLFIWAYAGAAMRLAVIQFKPLRSQPVNPDQFKPHNRHTGNAGLA